MVMKYSIYKGDRLPLYPPPYGGTGGYAAVFAPYAVDGYSVLDRSYPSGLRALGGGR